jgi:UDP-N-acetylmuramoylalanine--D-glutamate ligase
MLDFIRKKIEGKSILILGFGREGESTYNLLRKSFPELIIHIADKSEQIANRIKDDNTVLLTGDDYLSSINNCDLIFKSPGISLKDVAFDRNKITSQTDLFLDFYSSQVIGITGTKGKSTTSSLIYHILKLYDNNVVLVGNIGIPPFDLIGEIDKNTKIVFELSSHQLEYISKGPHIAILLNYFQEHLDYYKSYEDYQLSKFNITLYQENSDNFIFNADDKLVLDIISQNKLERNYYGLSLSNSQSKGCWIENDTIFFSNGNESFSIMDFKTEIYLKGEHNKRNILAAICASKILNVSDEIIKEGVTTFKGLEHRLEYIGEYNGVHYYNDSIATIPEATIEAVKALQNVNTLLLGGFDRGIDYNILAEFIASSHINNLIFLGDAGTRIMEGLKQYNVKGKFQAFVKDLEEAVKIAKEKTPKAGICLLSPAAASYDMFKNFEERGRVYKKLVKDDKSLTNSK